MTTTTTTIEISAVPEYSLKEVAEHSTEKDLWIIIHGNVYDITKYVLDHPGGVESLVEVGGQDATAAFEDIGHSEDAKEIMAPFLCGKVKDFNSKPARPQVVKVVRKESTTSPSKGASSNTLSKIGAASVVAGTATAAVYKLRGQIGHPMLSKIQRHLSGLNHIGFFQSDNGFAKGFLLAAAISVAFGAGFASYVSRVASIQSGFTKYPISRKMPKIPARYVAGFLNSATFQPLPLVAKEILPGQGLLRLTFELPSSSTALGLPIGQHVAIKAQVGDQTITRSYTPTSNNSDLGKLVLVLRIYDDGLLTGKYLSKLNIGDEVLFRGPKGAMKYRKGWAKKIGMVAGGTGITPMYQLIRAICEDMTDTTEVNLLYANRSEEDILLRGELDAWAKAYPKNLKVWYMLDKAPSDWKYGSGFITKEVLEQHLPGPSTDGSSKALLCGPPGMIGATKKNLAELGWKKPGAVGKMDDDVFCF